MNANVRTAGRPEIDLERFSECELTRVSRVAGISREEFEAWLDERGQLTHAAMQRLATHF
jgi:hypothetical protein